VNDRYAKINVSNMGIVDNSYSLPGDAEEGFANPFGNLVLLTDDHAVGSAFVVHQTQPDNNPPVVNFVSPANDATNQKTTSRVGVTFTDQVNAHSINSGTFIVRPLGGQALPGRYGSQTNIVNFTQDQPLQSNTTYEVFIPKGGIKDYAGNATGSDFVSRFSTGTAITPIAHRQPGPRFSLRAAKAPGRGIVFRAEGLSARGEAIVSLLDPRGSEIRRLTLDSFESGFECRWDGFAADGRPAPSGVYLARLRAENRQTVVRFLLD
jgi:hypothetical protein